MSPASLTDLALIFADQFQRPAIRAGLSMIEALNLTLPQAGTEEAQLTRLAWWDGELQRYMAGAPEHPATQALASQGLAVLQTPYWQTLIRGQAQRITTPNPDAATLQAIAMQMGAGYGAIATLLGVSSAVDHYQRLGSVVWLIDQLQGQQPTHRQHGELMGAAANQLAELGQSLVALKPGASHRFAAVLTALYQRTANRETRRAGSGPPGPLARVWIAWRTALQMR